MAFDIGFGTTILEAPGVNYRLTPTAAKLRLGVSSDAGDPLRWLVVNEGVAAVTRTRHGTTLFVAPKALVDNAYAAVETYLRGREATGEAAEPVALKLFEEGAWRAYHVGSAASALDTIQSTRALADAAPGGSYIIADAVSEEAVKRCDERLYSFVRLYRIYDGQLRPNLLSWLTSSGLIDYVMLSTYEPKLRCHVVKHVGGEIDYNGKEWSVEALGQPLKNQVQDRVFGQFIHDSMRTVEAERKPLMTGVDLAVNTKKGVLRTSFVRVLVPFIAPDQRALILGASSWTFKKAA